MSYEKNYLGKGTKVAGLDILTFSVNMEKAELVSYMFKEHKYVKLEIAKLKVPDEHGNTYTVYANVRKNDAVPEASEVNEPPVTKKGRKSTKTAPQVPDEDLPF